MKSFQELREKTLTPAKKVAEEVELEEAKTPSNADINKVLGPTKNAQQGIAALKKAFKVDDKQAKAMMVRAMENMDEDVEQVAELNRSTLTNYMAKASDARKHKNMPTAKVDKRYSGVAKASQKLDKMNNEEAEAVSELKIDTLRSYVKKSNAAMSGRSKKAQANMPKRMTGKIRALDRMAGGQHAKLQPGEKGAPFATHKAKKYKAEETDKKAPFDGPYKKPGTSSAIPGKHGQGPSTAKHLAKMGLKQFMNKDKKK
jgi:hypothetical protein